ncbi:PE family protein, partial [Mycobacterium sp. 050134]
QAISNAIAGAGISLGSLQTGGAAGVLSGLSSFGATVAGPYQALFTNTVNNLGLIGNTLVSNPFPFLHQLVNNQIFYGQTIATQFAAGIQNLPAELAALPRAIQAGIQQIANFNPVAFAQQLINTQIGYAQTIATGLQSAAQDLVTGIQTLPTGLATAFQDLLAGNPSAALSDVGSALKSAFLPGFSVANDNLVFTVTLTGPLGDLAPILTIPGQIAQSFTDLLPLGTVPHMVAQHATNLVNAFTNLRTVINLNVGTITFGIPLQLVLDGIGGPINGLGALNSSAVALGSALQTGDLTGALTAFLDAPANVANAFLNGTTDLTLPPASLFGLTSVLQIPLGGILTPTELPTLFLGNTGGPLTPVRFTGGGTGIGGIIPGLIGLGPQLAAAITSNM